VADATFSAAHAAAAFADKVWIVGGVSASYYTKRLESTIMRSDVVSSSDGIEWTEVLEEAPFRRRYGHSLVTFTDPSDTVERLVLVAGFSPEPATDVWVTTDGGRRVYSIPTLSPEMRVTQLVFWVLRAQLPGRKRLGPFLGQAEAIIARWRSTTNFGCSGAVQ
jgi:hypothetical protein